MIVAQMYRDGEIDAMDAVRRYAVILDWGTGDLLPEIHPAVPGEFRKTHVSRIGARSSRDIRRMR